MALPTKLTLEIVTPERPLVHAVVDEVTLVGSRCGPFEKAIALLAEGLEVSDLVSAVYPLQEGEAAFAAAGSPGMLKVLLTIPPEGQRRVSLKPPERKPARSRVAHR